MSYNPIQNTIEKFINPYNAKNQIIGIDDINLVEKYANIALKLNNSNTIVFASEDGLPFVSLCSETKVAEAWKNKIFSYDLNASLLNLKNHNQEELLCENNEENLELILNVFENKTKNAIYDVITVNSGLALYISKKANSILNGIDLAKKTIENNLAQEKFNQNKKLYSW